MRHTARSRALFITACLAMVVLALLSGIGGPLLKTQPSALAASPPAQSLAVIGGSSASDGALSLRVAHVHGPDLATAQAFRDLLQARGLQVSLLPVADASSAGYGAYDLILLSADSGRWSDAAARETLLEAGLPLVALGGGGVSFLEQAGLLADLTSGQSSASNVVPTRRGADAYKFPNDIPPEGGAGIPLYLTTTSAHWLELPEPLPDGAEIGRLPLNRIYLPLLLRGSHLSSSASRSAGVAVAIAPPTNPRYPIVQLKQRFLLWGFGAGPEAMTAAGQDLLINLLAYQSRPLTLPLRTRRFSPPPGVEQGLLDALAGTPLDGLHAFVQVRVPPGDLACADWANLVPGGVTELYRLYQRTHVALIAKGFNPDDPLVGACLRWVGQILPEERAHPTVVAGQFPAWADNGDGTVNLLARFMPDVSDGAAETILDAFGAAHQTHGDKIWAIVLAKTQVPALIQHDALRWLRPGPEPGQILNDGARNLLHVDEVQDASIKGGYITYRGLAGSGVTIGVWDNGTDVSHADLSDSTSATAEIGDHGTHVAGIVGGNGELSSSDGGTDFQWRGMAPEAQLATYYYHWDGAEMYEATWIRGMVASNHSYKMTCGDYDGDAQDADQLVRGDYSYLGFDLMPHLAVYAAGNQGTGAQYCEQVEDDPETGLRGYYSVLSPAKNVLTVGGVKNSSGLGLRGSSSRGPTWDGRLKPDLMGIGCETSTVPDLEIDENDNDCDGHGDDYCYPYDDMCGTSMASPSVTGVTALVAQQYRLALADDALRLPPEGLKALLINSATDLVQDPGDANYSAYTWDCPDMSAPVIYYQGPDFSTGYGLVHAGRAVAAAAHNDLVSGSISDTADVDEYTFEVLEDTEELRFTLVWSDPEGDPLLGETASQLVNDLDLALIDPYGSWHYPWVVDPLPAAADHSDGSPDPITQGDIEGAYRGVDHRNNVEQVVLYKSDQPEWAAWEGTWTLRVSPYSLSNSTLPQDYAVAGEWRHVSLQDIYPQNAGYYLAPDAVMIPVRVQNPHAGYTPAASGTSAGDWQVRIGDSGSNIWTDATVETAYGPVGDLVYLVVRPPDSLSAGVYYDLEVTLYDLYQVDQRVAEVSQPVGRASEEEAIYLVGTPRAPVDEMIVMDNSGSMGNDGKLDSAKNAARAFADIRQEGDQIGLTTFESTVTTHYSLTLITAGEPELNDVKVEINALVDLHGTALGSGLLDGKSQLETYGDSDHTWNILLVSDGMESRPPCWDTGPGNPACEGQASVQPDFVPTEGCPAIQIDTVSIGPQDASWHSLLADIADKTCGVPWDATFEPGSLQAAAASSTILFPQSLANTLADIYVSIADGNTHQQRLWEEAGLLAQGETITRTVELERGLPQVTFAVNWPDPASPIQVTLFRPDGTLVSSSDSDLHLKTDGTHRVYRLDGPAGGSWKLRLGAVEGQAAAEYLVIVSANTDLTMHLDFGLLPWERVPGAMMPVYVVLVDEVGPITGANVQVSVQRPGGAIHGLTLFDDGTHGDASPDDGVYTNEYLITRPGSHHAKARALGTAHDGELFQRHLLRHLRVPVRPRLAYVWDTDTVQAAQYKALLDGNGLLVDLITMVDLKATDLAPYQLIIVGPDTGLEATWGDATTVTHLRDSGKPVLGLGDGGHAFFGKLSLSLGYSNGAPKIDAEVHAVDPDHTIWSQPYDLVLGGAAPLLAIYQAPASPGVAVNLDQVPPDVEVLAQRPSERSYAWLAREGSRFLLWGFNAGPAAMTLEGKELFVNAVYYAFP